MSRNTEATSDVNTWSGGHLNYKEGFFTQLQTDELAKGINEDVVRAISAKRNEPEWMLEFRLRALSRLAGDGRAALAESALRQAELSGLQLLLRAVLRQL